MRESESTPEQAAVIPIRRVSSGEVQVCLIRRKNSAQWGIPKGYIERNELRQAALDEASEEAGLRGRVVGESIGTYHYQKGFITLSVIVFVMEVLEEGTVWQEMRWRERRWYSLEEAAVLLKRHRVSPMFDRIRAELA
jgi:8-oxo-dGTP pyrophosphatase MutT (NUDIX family)